MDYLEDIVFRTENDKLQSAAVTCRGLKGYFKHKMREAGRSDDEIQNSEYYKALDIALDLIEREMRMEVQTK